MKGKLIRSCKGTTYARHRWCKAFPWKPEGRMKLEKWGLPISFELPGTGAGSLESRRWDAPRGSSRTRGGQEARGQSALSPTLRFWSWRHWREEELRKREGAGRYSLGCQQKYFFFNERSLVTKASDYESSRYMRLRSLFSMG